MAKQERQLAVGSRYELLLKLAESDAIEGQTPISRIREQLVKLEQKGHWIYGFNSKRGNADDLLIQDLKYLEFAGDIEIKNQQTEVSLTYLGQRRAKRLEIPAEVKEQLAAV